MLVCCLLHFVVVFEWQPSFKPTFYVMLWKLKSLPLSICICVCLSLKACAKLLEIVIRDIPL